MKIGAFVFAALFQSRSAVHFSANNAVDLKLGAKMKMRLVLG